MLLSFRTTNHRSIREEQQLLLIPVYEGDRTVDVGREAVPVAGIFGPNAAGKSNVVDALGYMRGMVLDSMRDSEPGQGVDRRPFLLDPPFRDEPSTYVVDLLLDGVRYTYGFAVNDERVIEEWMYGYPAGRKRRVFEREADEYSYGEGASASMRQVAEITDSNVLFLTVAARSKQEPVLPSYFWFQKLRVRRPGTYSRFSSFYAPSEEIISRLTPLLRAADTGIDKARLIEETSEEFMKRVDRLKRLRPEGELAEEVDPPRRKHLVFTHRGGAEGTYFPLAEESTGTQTLYGLAVSAFQTLDLGAVLVIDELDSSLHPYLSAEIIKLFQDPKTNQRDAQLVFTSHDATLLGRIRGEAVLHRDQVWFVEKDDSGATELFPLSDFKPRKDENRERRYLAGRYGAVPLVDDELFATALESRGDAHDDGQER